MPYTIVLIFMPYTIVLSLSLSKAALAGVRRQMRLPCHVAPVGNDPKKVYPAIEG